ncbi:MAG: tetratricopeptide repeat protein [Thermodesulfobacteriota bacterium]|nr:tetratricopeptide repeat protein [Thermodesulfobacteriota bacterium]
MTNRIKWLWLIVACMVVLLLRTSPAFSNQIVIDSNDQFDFAYACMERGEYDQAVAEFERFTHFFPNDSRVPKARYLIGMCYLKSSRYEPAREIFSRIIDANQGTRLAGKALFLIGESYYEEGELHTAEYFFARVIEEYPFGDLKNSALYRLGWARMESNEWQKASEAFCKVNEQSPLYDNSRELAKQSLEGEALLYKDPAYAGVLAVIPGLGHVYVSRYKNAAVAFVLNALFIWAAVEAFHQDHNVLGGILAFLEIGWYSGNIYSAINATHKYNRKVRDDFRKGLKDQLDLRIIAAKKGEIALAMSLRF